MLSRMARKGYLLDYSGHAVSTVTDWAAVRARLKAARAAKGWTQKQLADAIGVTPTRIGQIETSIPPGEKVLTLIARELGRSVAWFRYGVAEGADVDAARAAGYEAGRMATLHAMHAFLVELGLDVTSSPPHREEGGSQEANGAA